MKAPVQLFSMEGRYATALYSAATKQQKLEKVEEDLKKIHVNNLVPMSNCCALCSLPLTCAIISEIVH